MNKNLNIILLAIILLLSINLFAEDNGWNTDFEKAKILSKEKEVPILVNFSGSDWCRWCIILDDEVFSEDYFKEFAKDNLVLYVADFPRQKEQAKEIKDQNRKLMEKYEIQGFPTILLVNSKGKLLARTGYRDGGAELYVEHLKELIKRF